MRNGKIKAFETVEETETAAVKEWGEESRRYVVIYEIELCQKIK